MQSQLKEIEKIRHSVVTDDYIALDRIQNKNWQYLIESISEICKSNNSNEAIEIKKLKIEIALKCHYLQKSIRNFV